VPEPDVAIVAPPPVPPPEPRERRFEMNVSFFWMPMFPLYGESYFLGSDSTFLGAGIGLALVLPSESNLNFGFELSGVWFSFEDKQTVTADANLLVQKWLPGEIMAINLRLGAGALILPGTLSSHDYAETEYAITLNVGFSLMWRLGNRFLVETGLRYANLASADQTGWFRPWIGLGWRL
jgi:hypothetical protein